MIINNKTPVGEVRPSQLLWTYGPGALIDLPSFDLQGKTSLFAACRLSDMKMGQLVSFERAEDAARFERLFVAD